MIDLFTVSFPAPTGEEERRAYVYLPEGFEDAPERRFPVLYMLDGHNLFFDEDATYGKSWGLGEYLEANAVPLIVAAVECNHHPENGRIVEYAPYDFYDPWFGAIRGRGRETMDWYVETFKPLVDGRYPTLPDRAHSFIAGSSMGGLMSLYALAGYGHVFSRAAALSPSIGFGARTLDAMLRQADFAPDSVLYMDYGEREMAGERGMDSRWRTVSRLLLSRGVRLTARIVPGGEHCEASWERQLPFAIPTLLYGLEEE